LLLQKETLEEVDIEALRSQVVPVEAAADASPDDTEKPRLASTRL
jgi:hypothetical protein